LNRYTARYEDSVPVAVYRAGVRGGAKVALDREGELRLSDDVLAVAAIVAAFVLAALVVTIARRLLYRVVARLTIVSEANREAVHARVGEVIRSLKLVAYGLAAIASVGLALGRLGVPIPEWRPDLVVRWAIVHGFHVVAIVAGAYIVIRAARLVIDHLQFKVGGDPAVEPERYRRAATLGGIASRLVTVVVSLVATLMLLRELSIDVLPLLTGAGIAGLAIGFGAQNLVRDVISGFFMILEDQIRVGDNVRINNVSGVVEEINLRTTVLRDAEGAVHVFPNGGITAVANMSKGFSYAVVDIAVGRGENLDRVIATLTDIGESMRADPRISGDLLSPLEVLGVEAISTAQVTVRIRFKTAPLKQWDVARELRRRIVTEFAARGITRAG
jgi:moderate conductance mechanosensitive channel